MPFEPGKSQSGEQSVDEPSRASRGDNVDPSGESIQKRIRQSTPSPHRGNTAQASPPRFVSVEELMDTAKGVSNLALAHEIVLNGGFQIKPMELPQGSLERTIRDILHKAFWDCLEAQFNEDPPVYDHAIILLGEIKEALFSFLLPGHTRLRNQINEVLDLELIKQEAEKGALDIPKLADFTIGMMGTLCAPARDEEIKKLRDIKEPVPLFRAIFAVLDLMKLDMANFAVSSIRPHLMKQSVEYERKKFQDFFDKQPNSLDCVTSWLQETVSEMYSKDSAGASSGPPCPVSVLNHAYLKLLAWNHEQKPFPETVVMDQIRFQEMKLELLKLTLLGTVLLITHNSAGPAVSGLAGFTDQMKSLIRLLLEGVGTPGVNTDDVLATLSERICVEVAKCLSQHGSTPFSSEREESLKGQIQTASSPSNQIYRIIESRIQSFLLSYLSTANQRASPTLLGGLSPIQKELEELAVKFVRLVNYNKMVFSPYYDSILSKMLNKQDTQP
ncbi:PREDICTED: T-complex protein 11-like protein 1 [Nanorana parkeri]|uniref:T-complex protein 11-like protein 1 n=1 Tax=Nanorana parkeri TaxID=125878 RepID=UPI00085440A8|nr:PREDICTED: T-complex protein 11-like protein 1 [Nanorana parkeri]